MTLDLQSRSHSDTTDSSLTLAQSSQSGLRAYAEEVEDDEMHSAIGSMEFDPDGPLMIEVRDGTVSHANHSNSGLSSESPQPGGPNASPDTNQPSVYQDSTGVFWNWENSDLDDNDSINAPDVSGKVDVEDELENGDTSDEEDGKDNNGSDDETDNRDYSWSAHEAPSLPAAQKALVDINLLLKPPRAKGGGYKECQLPLRLCTRLEWIAMFLHVYTDEKSKYGEGSNSSQWTASLLHSAHAQQSNPTRARNLRKWAKAYINNRDALPVSKNGTARHSRIEDEDVAADIATHLQSLGPYIRALDIVHYTAIPEVKK